MIDRGMTKWQPFNALMTYKDFKDIEAKRLLINKPIIMEDKILEINNILCNICINDYVNVKYYSNHHIYSINGYFKLLNKNKKYIKVDNTIIYFNNLLDMSFI